MSKQKVLFLLKRKVLFLLKRKVLFLSKRKVLFLLKRILIETLELRNYCLEAQQASKDFFKRFSSKKNLRKRGREREREVFARERAAYLDALGWRKKQIWLIYFFSLLLKQLEEARIVWKKIKIKFLNKRNIDAVFLLKFPPSRIFLKSRFDRLFFAKFTSGRLENATETFVTSISVFESNFFLFVCLFLSLSLFLVFTG